MAIVNLGYSVGTILEQTSPSMGLWFNSTYPTIVTEEHDAIERMNRFWIAILKGIRYDNDDIICLFEDDTSVTSWLIEFRMHIVPRLKAITCVTPWSLV